MQILEIWNNLFTKGLQIHSSFFYHICCLYFVNCKKNQKLMFICTNLIKIKFICIKWSRYEKLFSPDCLEFTLVFYIFSRFFQIFRNFKFKI
jgi:hypothetical protein